jgi:hypothetical protein
MNFDNRLTKDELQSIEIYANAKVLNKVLTYFMKALPLVNIDYNVFIDDLLIFLGAKSNGYSKEQSDQAQIYNLASKELKQSIEKNTPDFDKVLLQKINKEDSDRGERIFTSFILLNLFLLENAYNENRPHLMLSELWETVFLCLGGKKDKECIENTDHSINLIILFKVLLRTAGCHDEAFFLSRFQSLLSKCIPMLHSI